jgi:hypothetical protein
MSPASLAHRKPGTATILSVRPLTEADLSHLRERAVQQPIQKLKDSHHRVAQLLASSLYKDYEIASICGYSLAMIGLLKRDPANLELQAHYRALAFNENADAISEAKSRAIRIMTKADRKLEDLLDDDEPMTAQQLLAISADRHNRVGIVAKQTNLNINVDFAAKLEAAIARTKKVAAE